MAAKNDIDYVKLVFGKSQYFSFSQKSGQDRIFSQKKFSISLLHPILEVSGKFQFLPNFDALDRFFEFIIFFLIFRLP